MSLGCGSLTASVFRTQRSQTELNENVLSPATVRTVVLVMVLAVGAWKCEVFGH